MSELTSKEITLVVKKLVGEYTAEGASLYTDELERLSKMLDIVESLRDDAVDYYLELIDMNPEALTENRERLLRLLNNDIKYLQSLRDKVKGDN